MKLLPILNIIPLASSDINNGVAFALLNNHRSMGIIVFSALLLAIVGAFIFSEKFRKDLIASHGEASFGKFNVKGIAIIILIAVLAVPLVYFCAQPSGQGSKESGTNSTRTSTRKSDTNSIRRTYPVKSSTDTTNTGSEKSDSSTTNNTRSGTNNTRIGKTILEQKNLKDREIITDSINRND